MREVIDVKRASEVGYKGRQKYALVRCLECKKENWAPLTRLKHRDKSGLCGSCSSRKNMIWLRRNQIGEGHPNWKGGRQKSRGYISIRIDKSSPFYPMADHHGYIREHRLIVAKQLGRCLEPWEIVHHINGLKDDNRDDNLRHLPNQSLHLSINMMQTKINELENRIEMLEYENQLLIKKSGSQNGIDS